MRYVFLSVSLSLLGLLPVAHAQRTTANVYGIVTDRSTAIVAGAVVSLNNDSTGVRHTFTTNGAGEFSANLLPVGHYTLRVEAPGFKAYIREQVVLSGELQTRLTVTLDLGQVTEQITVSEEAPLLQNASAQMVDSLSRKQVESLPTANRDFTQLLTLQSGVNRAGTDLFQVNGLASAGITITVDGVDASGNSESPLVTMFGARNVINVISQEAIEEVNVSKGVISAETGRTFSGNFNVITKSGTNAFHGSLFENLRNDALNARYALFTAADRKPPIRFNQFGGSLGGPIQRNKAFFFGAFEGYRQANYAVVSGLVPTPEFRAQAIAALQAYREVLSLYPNPTQSYAPGAASGFYQGAGGDSGHDNHFVIRGDYHLNSTNRFSARVTQGRPFSRRESIVQANPQVFDYATNTGSLSFVSSGATWSSETRGGVNVNFTDRSNRSFELGFPAFNVQGNFAYSGSTMVLNGHTYNMEEIFARYIGRHTLKIGGTYLVQAPGRLNEELPVCTYANPAQFLANNPNQIEFIFGVPSFHGRTWNLAGFVQDDFRARSNLVLNLGLRYEYYSVFKDREGKLVNAGSTANAYANPPRFLSPGSIYKPDRNNFQPRVGLAWSPRGDTRTTIRSGFGITVAPMDLRNFYTLAAIDNQLVVRYRFTGAEIQRLGLKYPLTNAQGSQAVRTLSVPRAFEIFDESNPNPYAMQWTFDVQRQLTSDMVFQAGYVGTRGVRVLMNHNFNTPDRETGIAARPDILLSTVRDAADSSTYHALQMSVRKRLSRRFLFNAAYTWSKALAVSQGDYYGGNDPEVQNESNWAADWGPVNYDRKHIFTADFAYTIPAGRLAANRWSRQLFEGWQLGGVFRTSSGAALTPLQASGLVRSRPDATGADPYLSGSDRYAFLNPAAIARVPLSRASLPIRAGNVGKGSLRGPSLRNLDLAFGKTFTMAERFRIRFRAEAFNSTNSVILGEPVLESTRSDYGRVRTVSDARSLQISLRLTF